MAAAERVSDRILRLNEAERLGVVKKVRGSWTLEFEVASHVEGVD